MSISGAATTTKQVSSYNKFVYDLYLLTNGYASRGTWSGGGWINPSPHYLYFY